MMRLEYEGAVDGARGPFQKTLSYVLSYGEWSFGSRNGTSLGYDTVLNADLDIAVNIVKLLDASQAQREDDEGRATPVAPAAALPNTVAGFGELTPTLAPPPDRRAPDDKQTGCFQEALRHAPAVMLAHLSAMGAAGEPGPRVVLNELVLSAPYAKLVNPELARAWKLPKRSALCCCIALQLAGAVDDDGERRPFCLSIDEEILVPPPGLASMDAQEAREALDRLVCDAIDRLLGKLKQTTKILKKAREDVAAETLDRLVLVAESIEFGAATRRFPDPVPAHCFVPSTSYRFHEVCQRHRRAYSARLDATGNELTRDVSRGSLAMEPQKGKTARVGDLRRFGSHDLALHPDRSAPHQEVVDRLELTVDPRLADGARPMVSGRPLRVLKAGEPHLLDPTLVYVKNEGRPVTAWVCWTPEHGTPTRSIVAIKRVLQPGWRDARSTCSERWDRDVAVRMHLHASARVTVDGLQGLTNMGNAGFVLLSLGWQ